METPIGRNGAEPPTAQQSGTEGILAAIERLSDDASRSLRDQVDRQPYTSLGLGVLGGYVLGAGLTVKLGTLVLAAAWRAALANLVTRGIAREKAMGR